jgi:hypothetical protein
MEPKFHYIAHKNPAPVLIQKQMNPVVKFPPFCFFKFRFNIVLPSTFKSYSLFPSGFPINHLYIIILSRVQVPWQKKTGSGLDDWIYWHFYYNYNQL